MCGQDCMVAQNYESELPQHPALTLTKSWRCGDRIHSNSEAVLVAVQMMVNYLCNPVLYGHCCH